MLIIVGILDAASIITVTPVVDLMIHPDSNNLSTITIKINAILKSMGIPITLLSLMIVFLVFNILRSIFFILSKYFILTTRIKVIREMMLGTFDDFFNSQWYFFSSNSQGTLINTFSREIARVAEALGSMAGFFANVIQIIFYFAVPFYLTWKVSTVGLISALICVAPLFLLGKLSYNLGSKITNTANQLTAVITESLSSAKVILGFGNQQISMSNLSDAFDRHYKVSLIASTLEFSIPIIYFPLGMVCLVTTLLYSRAIAVPLSETVAVLYSLMKSVPLIGELSKARNSLETFYPSYEQLKRLRNNAKQLKQITGPIIFQKISHGIVFENVSFAYPGCKNVLNHINAIIPKGKMIAFVGESGAGKSTLIDMLMGFHEPGAGKIKIDNIPIENFDIYSLRQRIGYVPQEGLLFNTSIRNNLLWSNNEASESDIFNACKLARAHEFIQNCANGYDTIVGDRGVRLSGGEIQRIALARAILRKPELLILDEATSSLDSHSEQLIQQSIETIAKYTTIVVIAHRLSTIKNSDYVYVLSNGTIVEEGNYKELTNQGGLFAEMVQNQMLM
ncbi:MAG: ABC transporter ATP-binding protein/permease [Desulfobacterales bacterium]|nr:ABC transporter ATP-binding protein/permease [Desulfobacterales bacterium]